MSGDRNSQSTRRLPSGWSREPVEGEGTAERVLTSVRHGLAALSRLQHEDGSWRGDYGGPMFLLPMYVATHRLVGRPLDSADVRQIIVYIRRVQNGDGSIGLHAEAPGCMFTSALCYVALRYLGLRADDVDVSRLRDWIRAHGTPLGAASWGKFNLALLGLYEYDGLHPVLPELWLLPRQAPFHPGRLWCHCRQVYLPMAYLYGLRATSCVDDLTKALRDELYGQPYDEIDFVQHRDTIATTDDIYPLSLPMRWANRVMSVYERSHPPLLRRRALDHLYEHICYEDRVTHYIDIGPVNSILNALCHYFCPDGVKGDRLERSLDALAGYVCRAPDGTKFNGYNSTALWDTAFATQAILATPYAKEYQSTLKRAHSYIRDNQVLDDVPEYERYHRHPSRGGWPFSDRAHGWPISDCTAEGFKCAVALGGMVAEPIDRARLEDSIRLILSLQNDDGGWATYERKRGPRWLELFNPSSVFGGIMVDYSYVECTSACLQALAVGQRHMPGFCADEVRDAIRRGKRFIERDQRPEGGWEGSWAVCFTYGTWFGVSGLRAAGGSVRAPEVRRACGFLLQRQNPDGGWGERAESCIEGRYIRAESSRVVQTAWALSTLVRGGAAATAACARAAAFLTRMQLPDGDWPEEPLVGVFNRTALINYENYRRYFPVWALSEYAAASNGPSVPPRERP